MEYAELHAHSNFSFLDGASHPEEMVKEAARLGLCALAICDHDGLYGVVRAAGAARALGMPMVVGAELTLGLSRREIGSPDPSGSHLVVLARDPDGYARLSRCIAEAHLAAGEKGAPRFNLEMLANAHGGRWLVLTGCRKGSVPASLSDEGPAAAASALDLLIDVFGRENVAVELWSHDDPVDSARNDALARLSVSRGTELVATTNAHYATPRDQHLAAVLSAVRARRSLEEMDGWLAGGPGAHLRSGREQALRFSRFPGVVERSGEIGRELAFDLSLVAPGLPPFDAPCRGGEIGYLRELAYEGARVRYGPRGKEWVTGAWEQIDHELNVIDELGFAGYFLVVWDIVEFCRRNNIYCQGRGSAANSAVCFALGITKADAVGLGLLFERFLSSERDGPPDIDVDIESQRREEVIQYVYGRYGREHAAQVANVVTYRSRSSIRDAAKALGYAREEIETWTRALESDGGRGDKERSREIPDAVAELAAEMEGIPRHLGVHSGGMVICDRPVVEVCPVEWASAPGRTVLQWDKDDCAAVGLVKFDLLGLGMLEALHRSVDIVGSFYGVHVDLAELPQEREVYEMLCRADTVGVFQVESRAQMGTLPRLKPTTFYDLVIEVALIRPGPIQGGSVHPYLRRRNHEEEVTYPHPLLERSLKKTLGVPLFQEQLMQIAIDAAGFSPAEADELRQAMASKRSLQRMEALRARFYSGMSERGIVGKPADEIFSKMAAFANFGFPESHSVSFAYLVYASAWLKLRYPAAFYAGLLNSQPMGFWSPRTLVADAKRHGVEVLRPQVNASGARATLEPARRDALTPALRLGISSVKGIGRDVAERIAKERPYRDLEEFTRRTNLTRSQLETLAIAGALAGLDEDPGEKSQQRRRAVWKVGALAGLGTERLPGVLQGVDPPRLPAMDETDEVVADLGATGVTTGASLTELIRFDLDALGVIPASQLDRERDGSRVKVAGIVTHRQRPETARGVTFVSLEDETGLVNVVCSVGVWKRYAGVARFADAMVVRGRLESAGGVCNVIAERIESLELATATRSRDFR